MPKNSNHASSSRSSRGRSSMHDGHRSSSSANRSRSSSTTKSNRK